MKKILFFIFAFLLIISIGSCKDEEKEVEPPIEELKLDNTSLHLGLWNMESTVKIVSGNGNYMVETANELVATVYEKDSVIYITSVSNGATTISVKDAEGKVANVEVVVDAIIPVIPNTILWGYQNETKTFDLFDAYKGEYTLKIEDRQYADAKTENSKLIVTHKSAGQTDVTVSDKRGVEAVFNVYSFQSTELVIIPRELTIKVGETVKLPILDELTQYSISFLEQKEYTTPKIITEMGKPILEIKGKKKGFDLVVVIKGNFAKSVTLRVTVVE